MEGKGREWSMVGVKGRVNGAKVEIGESKKKSRVWGRVSDREKAKGGKKKGAVWVRV